MENTNEWTQKILDLLNGSKEDKDELPLGSKQWFFDILDRVEKFDEFKDEQSESLRKAFPESGAFDYSGIDLAIEYAGLAAVFATGKKDAVNWVDWYCNELDFGRSELSTQEGTNCEINKVSYKVFDKESLWTVLNAL